MDKKFTLTKRVYDFLQSVDKSQFNTVMESLKKLLSLEVYSSPEIREIENDLFVFKASNNIRIVFNYSEKKMIVVDIINKTGTNFSKANMARANLESSNFSFSNFSSANLPEANLSHAVFAEANFSKANLSNANLSCSTFKYANFNGTDLSNANLKSANFTGARNLDKVRSFKNAILVDTTGLPPNIIQNALAQGAKIKDE
jgi:uncharacterized protein YjbI with pentapeptide repeats